MISKAGTLGFILAKVGYVSGDALINAILQCFPAAVAGIGCYFFYGKMMLL
jgi:hypothetical protein